MCNSISRLCLSIWSSPMHRCQEFLFPFARCLNKSGHYQPSVFVAEASVMQMNITGKKSPRKRFIFVKDWHMFLKIIQDSLPKHFAAVTEQYQSCYCTDKAQHGTGLNFMRMPALSCARRASQKIFVFWSLRCRQSLSGVQGWGQMASCPVPHCG